MRSRVLLLPLMGLLIAGAIASALAQIPGSGSRPVVVSEREDPVYAPSQSLFATATEAAATAVTFRSARPPAYAVRFSTELSINNGDNLTAQDPPPAPDAAGPASSGRMVEIVFVRPPPPRPPDPGIRAADVDLPLYHGWVKVLRESPRPRRAQLYLPGLKKIFAEEGLPEALAWLAEAESSFDPQALNASGARGLFQLMPDVARERGLRLYPYDERDDPRKNARAAAVHLRQLYAKFDSWSLALAAYNAGEGCVRRSLKAADAQTFGEIADALPEETRVYVAKALAILAVREDLDPAQLDVLLGH